MRWTDLPPDREQADDREGPVVQRGEWQDLRQRLERLPAGHPSSLDDADPADEDRADRGGADGGGADGDRPDEADDRRTGRAGSDRSARLPGGHQAGPGPGRREPYRPWFASGDSPEPWFSSDLDE